MTTEKDAPAFPSVGEGFGNPLYSAPGMTKREYAAFMMAQGLLAGMSGESSRIPSGHFASGIAVSATEIADALLAELARRQGGLSDE